jgi:transposase
MIDLYTFSLGRPCHAHRNILDGIFWKHRTGAPWRDLPECYGPWQTIYTRFNRWSKRGVWRAILDTLIQAGDADTEWVMIDGTIVRAHQHSAGMATEADDQALGRSVGGMSTKIHMVVDAHGNPLDYTLTPGQTHDSTQAIPLLEKQSFDAALADKGYDSDAIREAIESKGAVPVIPSRSNRKEPRPYDKHIYRARHLVENLFAKIKQYRSLATRYDKTSRNYAAMVALACIITWLRL